jgi:hypothetical protein
MIQLRTILVLANSVRDGKHCVAGKFTTAPQRGAFEISNEWVRLSNPDDSGEGAVNFIHTICGGGHSAAPLDIIRVAMDAPCNDPDHPEDQRYIPQRKWDLVSTMVSQVLPQIADQPDQLWTAPGPINSIPAGYIRTMTKPATLYFVKAPPDVVFQFWKEHSRYTQREEVKRKLFMTYNGVRHELSVTDRSFTIRHKVFEHATGQRQTIAVPNAYLCVSLTKLTPKFNDKHWKICATILES